jgi:hypothetical protein
MVDIRQYAVSLTYDVIIGLMLNLTMVIIRLDSESANSSIKSTWKKFRPDGTALSDHLFASVA